MPMIALCETLDGATIAPSANTPTVAVPIATVPRDGRNRDPLRRVASRVAVSVTIAPAGRFRTTQLRCRVLSKTVHKPAACSQAVCSGRCADHPVCTVRLDAGLGFAWLF